MGDSARAVREKWQGISPAPNALAPSQIAPARTPAPSPLDLRALKSGPSDSPQSALLLHRALQEAAKKSDWVRYGAIARQQEALLERLVAAQKTRAKP